MESIKKGLAMSKMKHRAEDSVNTLRKAEVVGALAEITIVRAVPKIKFFSPRRHKDTKKTNNNKHFAASRLCGKVFFEFMELPLTLSHTSFFHEATSTSVNRFSCW